MAFSETDIETIKRAIATGELRVRFSDGREVEYRSIDELTKALNLMKSEVAAPAGGGIRSTFATFNKG